MTWQVEFSQSARKQLRKLDPQTQDRIRSFIFDRLVQLETPRDIGKPLVGEKKWRYRVGNYRIVVEIEDDRLLVTVVAVAHRRNIYR